MIAETPMRIILLNMSYFVLRKETKKWIELIGNWWPLRKNEHLPENLKDYDHKRQLFNEKVQYRTRHFSLALEDMMKTQNASALMRTADAFGIHK